MFFILPAIVLIVFSVGLYLTRGRWLPFIPESLASRLPTLPEIRIPGRTYIYSRLPQTFAGDVEAGLTSGTFDLSGNVEGGDGRAGLDDEAKAEILRIMKSRRVKFDAARKLYLENKFKANGIGPDGRPRDPKFVSFS